MTSDSQELLKLFEKLQRAFTAAAWHSRNFGPDRFGKGRGQLRVCLL